MEEKVTVSEFEFLAVRFIYFVIAVEYFLFLIFWCLPALQLDLPSDYINKGKQKEAIVFLVVFHALLALFWWSFVQTMNTDPGAVPQTDEWTTHPDTSIIYERDRTGNLRFDVAEGVFKPDRTHFCAAMGRNVLKMDHYCPWICNAVGFYNYKYFLLTLFYGALTLIIISVALFLSLIREWNDLKVPWSTIYFQYLTVSLSSFLVLIVTPFFVFHLYLLTHNLTTIEYFFGEAKAYNLGSALENIGFVLGTNPYLWLIPVGSPLGNGLFFPRIDGISHTGL